MFCIKICFLEPEPVGIEILWVEPEPNKKYGAGAARAQENGSAPQNCL